MNFVSEDQKLKKHELNVLKTALPRGIDLSPLYEILTENKDKKDAEFYERFKHRPPKALDEDETEFLDNYETTREYERQVANEEALQIRSFQVKS